MEWRTIATVSATILAGFIAMMATLFGQVSERWFSLLIFGPVVACAVTGYGPWLLTWCLRQSRRLSLLKQDQYDRNWFNCLVDTRRLVQVTRKHYLQSIKAVGADFKTRRAEEQSLHICVANIAEAALRISDSVWRQLCNGHPDTAMAGCRQLFELSISLRLIIEDGTLQRARRYQDFDAADLLRREIEILNILNIGGSESVAQEKQKELDELEGRYPGEYLSNNTWPNLPKGDRLSRMEERLKFVAKLKAEGHRDGTKWYEQQLRQHWLILNKWAHANFVSHSVSRRLGARGMGNRLLGPSFSGLDTPLILLMSSLQEIMEDFINLCAKSTELDASSLLKDIDRLHTKLWESIKKVDPALRSGDFQLVYMVKEEDAIPWVGNEGVVQRSGSLLCKSTTWVTSWSSKVLSYWKLRLRGPSK